MAKVVTCVVTTRLLEKKMGRLAARVLKAFTLIKERALINALRILLNILLMIRLRSAFLPMIAKQSHI